MNKNGPKKQYEIDKCEKRIKNIQTSTALIGSDSLLRVACPPPQVASPILDGPSIYKCN